MQDSTILKLGCPACGATYDPKSRSCQYCGCVLIVTGAIGSAEGTANSAQASAAAKQWRAKIKADPDDGEAHFALGLCYLNCNLHEEAIGQLREACELIPESAEAHYTLAATFLKKLDYDQGLSTKDHAEFEKQINYALRISPDFKEARAFRSFAMAQKEPNDSPRALAEYKRAVEMCPDIELFHTCLGICYVLAHNDEEAANSFQQALLLDPNDGATCARLCVIRHRQKRYDEGIEFGRQALSLGEDAHYALGCNLWDAGQRDEAKEEWARAAKQHPDDPEVLRSLGIVHSYEAGILAQVERAKQAVRRRKALIVGGVGIGVLIVLGLLKHVPVIGMVSHAAGALLLFGALLFFILAVVALVSPSAALFWTFPIRPPTSKVLGFLKNIAAGVFCAIVGPLLMDLPSEANSQATPAAQISTPTGVAPSPSAVPTPDGSTLVSSVSSQADATQANPTTPNVPAPKFTAFPATPFTGRAVPVQLLTDDDRAFRSRLRDASVRPVNFAGEYVLTTWGCGTECVTGAAVNLRTGVVAHMSFTVNGWHGEGDNLTFKPDSRLLVAAGNINETGTIYGVHFFEFKDDVFKEIATVPMHDPGLGGQDQATQANASANQTEQSASSTAMPAAGGPASLPDSARMIAAIIQAAERGDWAFTDGQVQALKLQIPPTTRGDRKTARQLNAQGLAALNQHDYQAAIQAFISAHRTDPADIEVNNNLGSAYQQAGQNAQAIDQLNQTLLYSPARAVAWENLAHVYAQAGNLAASEACARLTLRYSKNPVKTVAYMTSIASGNPNGAYEKILAKVLRDQPSPTQLPVLGSAPQNPQAMPVTASAPSPDDEYNRRAKAECSGGFFGKSCRHKIRDAVCAGKSGNEPGASVCSH